jgi:hypothetical protein
MRARINRACTTMMDTLYVFPQCTPHNRPFAQFNIGNNCPAGHFYNMQIIINLTFCGDWAGTFINNASRSSRSTIANPSCFLTHPGSVFGSSCGQYGSCNNYVQVHVAQCSCSCPASTRQAHPTNPCLLLASQYNPAAFGDAYWIFNSIKVYQYQ